MNMNFQGGALALPLLPASIPTTYYLDGKSQLPVALAIALLEANVITDDMLIPRLLIDQMRAPDESELSSRGLSAWWDALREKHPTEFFKWDLRVEQIDHPPTGYRDEKHVTGWFCLTRVPGEIPRFTLERRIMQLETVLEGFGETVLAVLYEAFRHLPEAMTPLMAECWAEWLHWNGAANDQEMLEMRLEEYDEESIESLLKNHDILTREKFYANMPEWVPNARRKVSRADIVLASGQDQFCLDVIAACDALIEAAAANGFVLGSKDTGLGAIGLDPTDGCVVLLWRENDVAGQVIDDAVNQFYEGDSTDSIDMSPVPLTKKHILKYQAQMAQMLQVARATERLIQLIGDPF